jgi:hypothetical protein
MRVELIMFVCQHFYAHWTNLDEIWYGYYASVGYPILIPL